MQTSFELFFALNGNEIEYYKLIENELKNNSLKGVAFSCPIVLKDNEKVEIKDGFKLVIYSDNEEQVMKVMDAFKLAFGVHDIYIRKVEIKETKNE